MSTVDTPLAAFLLKSIRDLADVENQTLIMTASKRSAGKMEAYQNVIRIIEENADSFSSIRPNQPEKK